MSSRNGHSIPVPRLYKVSANILKRVADGESLHDLVFSAKHRNMKAIYALVCNAVRNETLLETILSKSGIMNEKFDENLAKILVTELLWGKKRLPGDSKPVQTTLAFQSKLEEAAETSGIVVTLETVVKPRYVRVNTLSTTVNGTVQRFVDDGWELLDTPESYPMFLESIVNLESMQFMQDFHFDDVLVFPAKTDLHTNTLVDNGSLVLQDKASCLPPRLLNPEPGSVVLDMCAGPGMKTSHLTALMKNKGTLYAVDKDSKRHDIMLNKISSVCGRHSCVECMLADATQLTNERCPGVQYILVDPSCSGTGMSKRIEDRNDVTKRIDSRRLRRLAGFQERVLIQALTAFPDVERVVYSTCSILEEENEQVLERVLARVPEFQVVPPTLSKDWERRGDPHYSFGNDCLVANQESDLTNGFFVAVLERVPGTKKTSKEAVKEQEEVTNDGWEIPKKRKRNKRTAMQMDVSMVSEETEMNVDNIEERPKKKKRNKKGSLDDQ